MNITFSPSALYAATVRLPNEVVQVMLRLEPVATPACATPATGRTFSRPLVGSPPPQRLIDAGDGAIELTFGANAGANSVVIDGESYSFTAVSEKGDVHDLVEQNGKAIRSVGAIRQRGRSKSHPPAFCLRARRAAVAPICRISEGWAFESLRRQLRLVVCEP